MSPIVSCHSYLVCHVTYTLIFKRRWHNNNCYYFFLQDHSENITDKLLKFRSALVQELNRRCQMCGLTAVNIRDDEFSCRGGLTNHIIYRAMIIGTNVYSPIALVSLLQSWVESGSASITVESQRLNLDEECSTPLDSLSDLDCPLVTKPPPQTTTSTTVTTQTETTAPLKTTEKAKVVSDAAVGIISAGQIGGIIVVMVIIALIAVLLVAVTIAFMRWRAVKKSKAYDV